MSHVSKHIYIHVFLPKRWPFCSWEELTRKKGFNESSPKSPFLLWCNGIKEMIKLGFPIFPFRVTSVKEQLNLLYFFYREELGNVTTLHIGDESGCLNLRTNCIQLASHLVQSGLDFHDFTVGGLGKAIGILQVTPQFSHTTWIIGKKKG